MLPGSVLLFISSLDLLTVVIISLITLFLLVILRIDTILVKPKIYLKLALSMVLIVLLIDELIELNFPFAVYLHPVSYFVYFAIYPVIYVYSRDIVFNGQDSRRPSLLVFLIFPIIVLTILSILFYPLPYSDKVAFVNLHISESMESFKTFMVFKAIIIPAYYIQTAFYIVLTFMLISVVKKNTSGGSSNLLIVRFILIYIIGVIIEVKTLLNEILEAGFHEVDFNASSLASGVYIYRIEWNDKFKLKKMMMIK